MWTSKCHSNDENMKLFCLIFFIRTLLVDSSFVQLEVDSSQKCIKNVLKNETEHGEKILLGKYILGGL